MNNKIDYVAVYCLLKMDVPQVAQNCEMYSISLEVG